MENITQEQKNMAIISYFVFFVPLLTPLKDDEYVRFHVKQSMSIVAASIVVAIVSTFPVIGWFIVGPLGGIFCLVLWLLGLLNAINSKKEFVPIVGKYAENWFKFID